MGIRRDLSILFYCNLLWSLLCLEQCWRSPEVPLSLISSSSPRRSPFDLGLWFSGPKRSTTSVQVKYSQAARSHVIRAAWTKPHLIQSQGRCNGTTLNQIMFQTSQLSSGSHKLDIVYQGNSQSTPLTINVLIVQNGESSTSSNSVLPSRWGSQISGIHVTSTVGTRASSLSSSFLTSPISAATILPSGFSYTTDSTGGVFATRVASAGPNSTHNSSNLGPIIGGMLDGLALLLLAIFGCLFLRRDSTQNERYERNCWTNGCWTF